MWRTLHALLAWACYVHYWHKCKRKVIDFKIPKCYDILIILIRFKYDKNKLCICLLRSHIIKLLIHKQEKGTNFSYLFDYFIVLFHAVTLMMFNELWLFIFLNLFNAMCLVFLFFWLSQSLITGSCLCI